jgi:hypothetical protein
MVKEHNETPINISLVIMVVAIFFAFYMAHKFPANKTNVEINQTSIKNEYKKSSYFNTEDTYVFESSLNDVFESKVEL